MSDLQDRLEQLARRGTPRGGGAVLQAAKTNVEHDAVTAIGMERTPSRSPRRHFSSLVAAAGVAATLFVAMLAFSAFIGAGSGSDSPEGAVRQLADAVSREDTVAAADVLVPEEVRSLNQTVDVAAKRAQELALARTATAPLAGLDLSVDNLNLSTETMAPGYVKVTVSSGTLSTNTQTDKFSPVMQQVLRNSGDGSSQVDLASLAKSSHLPTFVMAIERDGHWYVSAAYTTLEYIREANQLPPADFGSGARVVATLGADSPDAAVQGAMRALASQDWEKLISLAPPDEIPVYDYRAALTQLGRERNGGFTIDKLETAATVDGDIAKVSVHAKGITNDSGQWALDGSCFQPPLNDGRGMYSGLGYSSNGCESPFFIPFFASHSDTAAASQVTVVRKAGRWFVSPVGTVLDLVDQYVRELTQRQLYTLLGVPQQLPPDAKITLGQPVTPVDAAGGAYVYALDAHRGDRLLGLVTTDPPLQDFYGAQVLVYSPDGEILRNTYDLIDGRGLEIPTDGTYKVVLRPYYERVTLTIWNEADAPDAAKHPPTEGMYQGCRPTSNGGETCSASASSSSLDGSVPSMTKPTGKCRTEPNGSTSCMSTSVSSSGSVTSSGSCTYTPAGGTECTSSGSASSSSSSSSSSGRVNAPTSTSVPGG